MATIRELTPADRAALAGFTCAKLGQPWTEVVQSVIRNDLADQVETGDVSAVGLFDDDGALCGLAAWRLHDRMPPVLCRGDIVAVAVGAQGRGHGRALKTMMIERAEAGGAQALSSVVHRSNVAMIGLNRKLGAVVADHPDDPHHCLCVIRLG